jgi:hypothetical protein
LNNVTKLQHYGISPYEIEALYSSLARFSEVDEIKLDDSEYLSLLNIEFPVPYDDNFFQSFGFDNWQRIKYIFKEMKRRRGKKGFKLSLSFSGSTESKSKLVFSLTGDIGAQFEYALEKIAHMVDSINLKNKNLDTNRQVTPYAYDPVTMKWLLSEKSEKS